MNADTVHRVRVPQVADSREKLLFAAVASLLLHATLAWGLYDRQLGIRGSHAVEERVLRIRLAQPQRHWSAALTGVTDDALPAVTAVDELSAALLAASGPDRRDPGRSPSFTPTDVEDEKADATQPPAPAIHSPDADMDRAVLDQYVGALALDTPYVEDDGGTGQGAAGDGDGSGGSPGEAQRLLARAGLNAAPPTRAAALAPPDLHETPPGSADRRPTLPIIRTPPLNLDALELQAALELDPAQSLDEDFDYVLTTYRPVPKHNEDAQPGYLRMDITGRRSLRKLATMPKDVVYVIDVSGSVSQEWVNAAAAGVRDALGSLNEGDRFNIVMFSEQPAFFSPEHIQPANAETLEAAAAFLAQAQSSGDTDVNRALSRLLVRDVAIERVYELVLISDGRPTKGVTSTRDLINIITRDNDLAASIYCVGVGDRQNQQLLEFLAYRNHGFCVFAKTSFEAPQVIRDLASRLRYPIIKNVRVLVSGLDASAVFPNHVPNIHQGETFSIFGRFEQPEEFTMQLVGRGADTEVTLTMARHLGRAPQGDEAIAHDWAFWKLHHLYSEMLQRGDDARLRAEIDRLAKQYKLKTVY